MANIEIGGRLHSTATGNVVTGANEVLDDTKNKKQSVINAEVDETIGDDNTAGTIKGRIKTAEGKLDTLNGDSSTSGSVAKAVADAKTELIGGATSNGNTLKKVEDRTATLETAVGSNGSVDQRIAAAKSEVIGDAASDYNTLGKLEDKIQAEASARQDAITAETNRATTRENQIYDLVHTPEQHYVTVATYADLANIASPSDDTIYRVSSYNGKTSQVDNTAYSEYGYDGTNFVFLCIKSQIDEVYDISAHHSNNTYVDLAAALDGGNNIPQELRKGGMSVKFVQSSDNKYVQYRCMAQNFTTDVTQWQGVEDILMPINGFLGDYRLEEISYTNGYIAVTNEVADTENTHPSVTAWRYALINCTEGDAFVVGGITTQNSAVPIWAFLDADNHILKRSEDPDMEIDLFSIVAPENTVKLLLEDKQSGKKSYEGAALEVLLDKKANKSDVEEQNDKVWEKLYPLNNFANPNITPVQYSEKTYIRVTDGVADLANPVTSSAWRSYVADCTEGDMFIINGETTGNPAAPIWAFLDSSNNIISSSQNPDLTIEGLQVVAPIKAVKILLEDHNSGKQSYIGKNIYSLLNERVDNKELYTAREDVLRLELLPYGKLIDQSGEIHISPSPTPAWRGTTRLKVSEGERLKVDRASFYLLYDYNKAITSLVAVPSNKIIEIPSNAAYIVFDITPNRDEEYMWVRRLNGGCKQNKLALLDYGEFISNDGQIHTSDNPNWRGTEKLPVNGGTFLRVPDASWYVLYDSQESPLTQLVAVPDDKIIYIPFTASYIAFDYVPVETDEFVIVNVFSGIDNNVQWRGKKWYAFGCSLTDIHDDNGNQGVARRTGIYPLYLARHSGLIMRNWAYGGSAICWKDATHPNAYERVLAAVNAGELTDADIVTLDGAVNDWSSMSPLGEITDEPADETQITTICGGLYLFVKKIREVAPNANIVFITDSTGKDYNGVDCSYNVARNSLTQKDYWDVIIKFARYVGVSVIDAGGKCEISSFTPQYIYDHIHHTEKGGEQFANTIWEQLKDMNPNVR